MVPRVVAGHAASRSAEKRRAWLPDWMSYDSQAPGICFMPPARAGRRYGVRLLPLQRENLVLDAEFLTLQIVHRVLIGQGTMDFLVYGAFERCMFLAERLDAILQRHCRFPPARRS